MQQDQLKQLLPLQRQQNPLLKKKPLNLGTQFYRYSMPDEPIILNNPLLQYQLLLIFFGANWCNISKIFIKDVQKFYQQVNLQKKKLEIIYVNLDKQQRDYPWISIKFDDPRVKELKQFYNITAIPSLILLDNNGDGIMHDCRKDIYQINQDLSFQKWVKIKKQTHQNLAKQAKLQIMQRNQSLIENELKDNNNENNS